MREISREHNCDRHVNVCGILTHKVFQFDDGAMWRYVVMVMVVVFTSMKGNVLGLHVASGKTIKQNRKKECHKKSVNGLRIEAQMGETGKYLFYLDCC